ncbi:MAG: OprD family outer membrane porin [Helicobacteraceae bacterium]|nr:OprD family outer membrane porin [Helicobacteraceae bacterium]
MIKISAVAALTCALAVGANASESKPKRELKNNMMVITNTTPAAVDNIADAFTEGTFYGRLRMNAFKWDWKDVDQDNKAFGVGGSMTYKTAPFAGVSATAGLYYANSPFSSLRQDNADIGETKAGKDTFSRYNVNRTGDWSMATLAEAYLQYDVSKTTFKAGRQIFESFLTKSNDTKMIPNTFMGYVVETKELPKTTIRAAYFTEQKLRDHTTFHDPLTFGTEMNNDNKGNWNNNDDSAIHKGLSFANITNAGGDTNNALIVADLRNKSIENLQIDLTYGLVPDMVSNFTAELNYKINLGDKLSLTPGIRHMQQFDDGAGAIGGATLKGGLAGQSGAVNGYKEANSLDSSLTMARLVLTDGIFKAQIGYSAVADEGDIVAPWRGFPTGGYTRAMAQYNWYANTKTTAAEVHYNFGKAGIVPGFQAMLRYAMQDFDEAKQAAGVQADSNIIHIDLNQRVTPALYAKLRIGLVDADERVGSTDKDSYNEYRFELNYLF